MLLVPRTRRAGALAAVALYIAVFPANVNMVRLWWDKPLADAGRRARPAAVPDPDDHQGTGDQAQRSALLAAASSATSSVGPERFSGMTV